MNRTPLARGSKIQDSNGIGSDQIAIVATATHAQRLHVIQGFVTTTLERNSTGMPTQDRTPCHQQTLAISRYP